MVDNRDIKYKYIDELVYFMRGDNIRQEKKRDNIITSHYLKLITIYE